MDYAKIAYQNALRPSTYAKKRTNVNDASKLNLT